LHILVHVPAVLFKFNIVVSDVDCLVAVLFVLVDLEMLLGFYESDLIRFSQILIAAQPTLTHPGQRLLLLHRPIELSVGVQHVFGLLPPVNPLVVELIESGELSERGQLFLHWRRRRPRPLLGLALSVSLLDIRVVGEEAHLSLAPEMASGLGTWDIFESHTQIHGSLRGSLFGQELLELALAGVHGQVEGGHARLLQEVGAQVRGDGRARAGGVPALGVQGVDAVHELRTPVQAFVLVHASAGGLEGRHLVPFVVLHEVLG